MIKICKACLEQSLDDYSVSLDVTRLYFCTNCSVVFAHPNYTSKKGDYHGVTDSKQWEEYYEPFRIREYENITRKFSKEFSKARSFLDIGCGVGWFLDVVKKNYPNIKTVGVEPSRIQKNKISKKHKLYSLPAEDISRVVGRFDIISFWHVFEHLTDPNEILGSSRKKLNSDGILIISVPNRNGIMYRISYLLARITLGIITYPLKKLWWIDNPHGHLFDYNLRSLKKLLEVNKFDVIDWETSNAIDIFNTRRRLTTANNSSLKIFLTLGSIFLVIITKAGEVLKMQDVITITARKT